MFINGVSFATDPHVRFKAGQAVFKEGEPGESMFVLLNGLVDVYIGDELVGTFEPLEIVGELSVIDPGPRCATVIAKTDCELALINQRRFKSLALHHPEFVSHVMKMLVERIRWMAETDRAPAPEVNKTESKSSASTADSSADVRELKATIAMQTEQIRELQELIEFLGQKEGLTVGK